MSGLREIGRRLRRLLSVSRVRRELEEEMQLHLDLREQQLRDAGLPPAEARAVARRRFGQAAEWGERGVAARGQRAIDELGRDVRHALRAFRRTPVFAAVAILTLALGIGANTAIFSIVYGVLLRPLGYPRPSQLIHLTTRWSPGGAPFPVAVSEYLEFQQFNTSFSEVGAFRTGETNLTAGDRALRVRSAIVDAYLLNTLGVQAAHGRLFTQDDTGVRTAPPIAVLSYDLWQAAFGGRPIVGHMVDVGGRRVEVVGVMARGADLMDTHTEIWLPLAFAEGEIRARSNHNLTLVGRLKEGVTLASAQTELSALTETWSARAGVRPGEGHAGHVFQPLGKGGAGHTLQMIPLADQILGRAGRAIWVLQAAIGIVLLIACANVASLLLARAEARQREFAVLTALGASRGRLLRKAMTESVILAIAGAALGVLLARVGVAALIRAYPDSLPRIGEVTVDLRVMLVSLAVAIACGLFFGLAPMLHARSEGTADVLKSGPRGSTGTTRHRLRRALVSIETALAVLVVVGAGLLLRTVHNLTTVDAGFDRSRLVTFSATLPLTTADLRTAVVGVPRKARVETYQRLLEQLRAVPGVEKVTAMTGLPLESPPSSFQTEIPNNTATPGEPVTAINAYQRVMSDYFETMGIPILQGRGFEASDALADGWVVVVNETLAETFWKGMNPIGQRLRPWRSGNRWFTVIGVAKAVKQGGVDQPAGTEAYTLVDQLATDGPTTWLAFSPATMQVALRTTLPLSALAPTIARVMREVDPSVPVARLREMDEVFAESIRRPRLLAQLLTLFSALALVLAAIGTYGVLSYMVAERRREIGIRIALGAARSTVLGQVIGQGLRPTIAGVAVGLAAALALNRLMASLLFGVQPTDVATLTAAVATITLLGVAACWLPAWRASRMDPSVVLRGD